MAYLPCSWGCAVPTALFVNAPCQNEKQDQEAALVQQVHPLALTLQVVEFQHLKDKQ